MAAADCPRFALVPGRGRVGRMATRPAPNSRESLHGAGWICPAGRFSAFVPQKRPLSWLQPRMLWEARNDTVARRIGDPVNDIRRAWMRAVWAAAKRDGAPDPRLIDRSGEGDVSFMVVGDPGEGDASQWATIPPLEATWGGTDFIAIMSDVIYPAGNVNEYQGKFYRPYRDYPAPIYGIPANCSTAPARRSTRASATWASTRRWR